MPKKKLLHLLLITVFIASCQKKEISATANLGTTSRTLTPQYFNWETADTLPHFPGKQNVLVPWSSGVSQQFPEAFMSDWKRSDGWELIYNTFSDTLDIDNKYFTLYNKYRGLLRTYFWVAPSSPIPTRKLVHTLFFTGASVNSPLIFGNSDIINKDANTINNTAVQPYQTSATGAWYAAEFELNYIPNISSLPEAGNRLQWALNAINITDINLDGSSTGSIEGTLTTPGAPASAGFFGSLLEGGLKAVSNKGEAWALGAIKKDSTKYGSFLTSILTQGITAVAGKIPGLLSGLLSGGSVSAPTITYANLVTKASYTFTGTLESNSLLSNPSMTLPGSAGAGNTPGFAPLYNHALGIFTLTGTPTAIAKTAQIEYLYSDPWETDDRATRTEYFESTDSVRLDPSSFSIVFNPDIVNTSSGGVTIQNLKTELVVNSNYPAKIGSYIREEEIDNKTFKIFSPATATVYLTPAQIDYNNVIWGGVNGTIGGFIDGQAPDNLQPDWKDFYYLRVSFNVVPNNGTSPRTAIFKTFKVNINQVYY